MPAHPGAVDRLKVRHLTPKPITVFNKLGMLADLMGNASKLRDTFEKAFESLGQIEVEGSAGGGAVTAKVNGRLEVVAVRIDPSLLAEPDAELLEDLIAAAVNAGLIKARETAAQSLSSLTGGLPMGLLSGLGGGGPAPGGEGGR
jgi:nucleoid-associated protein EbfC